MLHKDGNAFREDYISREDEGVWSQMTLIVDYSWSYHLVLRFQMRLWKCVGHYN
jgi:hypothetical protein